MRPEWLKRASDFMIALGLGLAVITAGLGVFLLLQAARDLVGPWLAANTQVLERITGVAITFVVSYLIGSAILGWWDRA